MSYQNYYSFYLVTFTDESYINNKIKISSHHIIYNTRKIKWNLEIVMKVNDVEYGNTT